MGEVVVAFLESGHLYNKKIHLAMICRTNCSEDVFLLRVFSSELSR